MTITMTQLLENDLSNALADGETLARTQISTALTYLAEGQRFSAAEIRELLDELVAELPMVDSLATLAPITAATRWVN